jgi:hypothetical protein
MNGNYYPERAGRLWEVYFEWRRMKTTVLATVIGVLVIFFNEVLAK